MPKSKRETEVRLTKVKKKTKERKMKLVEEVRNCVDTYKNLFLFEIGNMRSTKFIDIRQKFKTNSRFFYGKNNVMAVALGRDPATECAPGLSKMSAMLKGECGLMFTNEDKKDVIKYFKELHILDYARCGQMATSTVKLSEGPLPQFPFSVESQLRKLGLPTKLDKARMGNGGSNAGYLRRLFILLGRVSRSPASRLLGYEIIFRVKDVPSEANSSVITMQKQSTQAFVPSEVEEPKKELRFSDSRAYFGVDKRELLDKTAVVSQTYLEAFSPPGYRRNLAISFLSSFAAVCIYFWYSRRDYNGFLNAPKYEVVPTLKRYALRQQIERAKQDGKDTTYLEAALAYVDVEEAVYRAEEGAFTLEN